jgi:hypothetical protein
MVMTETTTAQLGTKPNQPAATSGAGGDKPKSGVGTPTPDEFGSYGTPSVPKTSNDGKGGDTKGEAHKASEPPGEPASPPVAPAPTAQPTPVHPGAHPGVAPGTVAPGVVPAGVQPLAPGQPMPPR